MFTVAWRHLSVPSCGFRFRRTHTHTHTHTHTYIIYNNVHRGFAAPERPFLWMPIPAPSEASLRRA